MNDNALDSRADSTVPDISRAVRLLNAALFELDNLGAATAAAHVSNALALIGEFEPIIRD